MKHKFNWQLYAKQKRHAAVLALKAAISASDGWIVQHQRFSDLAMSLTIELPLDNVPNFHAALQAIAVVDGEPPAPTGAGATRDCWVFLNVTFPEGTGDVALDVPMVPG